MTHRWLPIMSTLLLVGTGFPTLLAAQTERGPYARIATLRPHDGDTVDFEAGYIRHLEWHRQAGDKWSWYGWTIWAGERQRWFIYASFGHTAADLSNPVSPLEDERDNISNVTPHCEFAGNAVYEFLPALSRGTGVPQPTPRAEFTTVELKSGAAKAFEAALSTHQSTLQAETLWFRMVAGAAAPRYFRIRARPSLAAILDERGEQSLPDKVNDLIAKTTIEIVNLRSTMSYNLEPPTRQ
jgi:hypothetical protein